VTIDTTPQYDENNQPISATYTITGDDATNSIHVFFQGTSSASLTMYIDNNTYYSTLPASSVVIYGRGGNDHIQVDTTGIERPLGIYGDDGADDIIVMGLDVDISGGAGNDGIYVIGASDDVMSVLAGEGNDSVVLGYTGDDGGTGSIYGGPGDDVIDGQFAAGPLTLRGEEGNDTIDGGNYNDGIIGGAGSDTVSGGAGNDVLTMADGERDVVRGGPGYDIGSVDDEDDYLWIEELTVVP
jgi:Ca2+-binding RTX toxin-like protein